MEEYDEKMKEVLCHFNCPRGEACAKRDCMFHHKSKKLVVRLYEKVTTKTEDFPSNLCLKYAETGICSRQRTLTLTNVNEKFFVCEKGYHPTVEQYNNLKQYYLNVSSDFLVRLARMGPVQPPCPICKVSLVGHRSGMLNNCQCSYHFNCLTTAFLNCTTFKCRLCSIDSSSYVPWNRLTGWPSRAEKKMMRYHCGVAGVCNEINEEIRGGKEDLELFKHYTKETLSTKLKDQIGTERYNMIVGKIEDLDQND